MLNDDGASFLGEKKAIRGATQSKTKYKKAGYIPLTKHQKYAEARHDGMFVC